MAATLGAAVEVAICDKTMHDRMVKLKIANTAVAKTKHQARRIKMPPANQ